MTDTIATAAKPPEHLRTASPETLVVHADRHLNTTSSVAPPIYQTATFSARSADEFVQRASEPRNDQFYTRHSNPTFKQAEAVIASLEGAESAIVTASGLGALAATVLALVEKGSHIVAQQHHYAGTAQILRDLLPKFGVETTYVDQRDPANFEKAIRAETRLILVESPSNPLLRVTDLRAVADIARARGIPTLADNTFATPINQRPISLGIDLVFHSGTKYFGGHSDLMAGAVVGSKTLLEQIHKTYLMLGAVPGPFDCWLMLRGLRTLPMRVRQHNSNALSVARFLARHSAVEAVHYPGLESHPQHELARSQMSGFGGMLSVEFKAGYGAAERFISRLRLPQRAASLGGVESLVVHPAAMWVKYMTPEQLTAAGIPPGLVRLSIGLEAAEDLIADMEQALAQADAA